MTRSFGQFEFHNSSCHQYTRICKITQAKWAPFMSLRKINGYCMTELMTFKFSGQKITNDGSELRNSASTCL